MPVSVKGYTKKISDVYKRQAQGYITGHANTTLIDPTGNATRAQMASILARYINNTKA